MSVITIGMRGLDPETDGWDPHGTRRQMYSYFVVEAKYLSDRTLKEWDSVKRRRVCRGSKRLYAIERVELDAQWYHNIDMLVVNSNAIFLVFDADARKELLRRQMTEEG